MNELAARFEKRFRGGACVAAQLQQPIEGFSVLVLFGPSGSGKTTILRSLAGLETPDDGTICFGKETWFDAQARVNLRPQQRGVGFLFQQYALFPHLTVRQNIAFGVRDKTSQAARASELIERFDLGGLEERRPGQISGGQQQRVALARTLACRPRLLLLDEPLSSLDQSLREHVRGQLRGWLSAFAVPTILVTHDRTDAAALGDRIAVLCNGQVLQQGPIQEVFSQPRNEAVAHVIGVETIVEGHLVQQAGNLVGLNVQGVTLWATVRQPTRERMLACIRGEDVAFSRQAEQPTSIRNRLPATITALTPEGPLVRVALDCGFALTALVTKPAYDELELRVGDRGFALIKATAVHVV
ncbi:MAG TPA: ABC transporter ATP-binding protein [Pirellulales bacterium]|jgi:molybdate transport system ATP-binding protein|nr:ABC transporter ATP-binding protein [Pirellulales bacterium]